MNGQYLKDVRFDGGELELIHTWKFIQVNNQIRIYYKERAELQGFDFYAVSWISHENGEFFEDINTTEVECLVHGIAYWDGIRHLYFGHEGTGNYGYHYYPHIVSEHIATFTELRKLEEKFCQEYEN